MASNQNFESTTDQQSRGDFPGWNERSFSKACNNLLTEVSNFSDGADLFQILELLNSIHPEYGTVGARIGSKSINPNSGPYQNLVQFLQNRNRSFKLSKLTSRQWADEVLSIFSIPHDPPIINGRLFLIAALLSKYGEVFLQLNHNLEWQKFCIDLIEKLDDELVSNAKISFNSLLTEKGRNLLDSLKHSETEHPEDIPDDSIIDTNNLSDGPAKEDSLSRKALAKYLAKRLRHIFNRDIDIGKYGSFFMHIDGAWGSGKSTLLGFLEEELAISLPTDRKSNIKKRSDGKWVIVNFNAWENQRLDPPWWFLMKSLYNDAIKSLKPPGSKAYGYKALQDKRKIRKLIRNEYFWRLNTGNNFLWVAIITLILFVSSLLIKIDSSAIFQDLPIVKLITLLGFLWSSTKVFGTSLASGSAKAAQNFVEENGKDPLKVIAEHFKDQINIIDYPVAIFIDDLDRCNKEYGIKLLEGLQTIFKKAGVVYVIAADRKWLSTMYEHQYGIFASVLEKPSKPFGMVFLDKIFQLIVELPDISSVQKKIYWNNLLKVSNKDYENKMKADKLKIKQMVETAGNNAGKMNVANKQTDNPAMQQMVREEVLGSLSIREEETKLEHKLQHFIDLIEPNPRAMKRLINDISTAKAISFLYKQEVDEDQLILWTILKLQHPLLADYFWNHPEMLDRVTSYKNVNDSLTGNRDFDLLIANKDVKRLFQYKVKEKVVRLNKVFLLKLKFKVG